MLILLSRLPPFESHKTYPQPFPLAAWRLLVAGSSEMAQTATSTDGMTWKLLKAPFTSPTQLRHCLCSSVSLIQGNPCKNWLILQMRVTEVSVFRKENYMCKTILSTFATRKPK